jgi:hypothetical protein
MQLTDVLLLLLLLLLCGTRDECGPSPSAFRKFLEIWQLPWPGDRPVARPLPTQVNTNAEKNQIYIYAPIGIATHDPQCSSSRRQYGLRRHAHWDWLNIHRGAVKIPSFYRLLNRYFHFAFSHSFILIIYFRIIPVHSPKELSVCEYMRIDLLIYWKCGFFFTLIKLSCVCSVTKVIYSCDTVHRPFNTAILRLSSLQAGTSTTVMGLWGVKM